MKVDYAPFCTRMIQRYEGGYGWNRNDPGGPTNFGVTCWDLAAYDGEKMNSMVAWAPRVQAMTLQTAEEIYATKYATACAFDALVAGSDCVVMDFGVNSGPSRSVKTAQRIVGVAADGVLGPVTLGAVNDRDPVAFVDDLCDARLSFLRGLGTWPTFGAGWTARVADLRAYSLRLASPPPVGLVLAEPETLHLIPGAEAKGYHPDDLPGGGAS